LALGWQGRYNPAMSEETKATGKPPPKLDRAEREAAALRANLAKRKAQQRARRVGDTQSPRQDTGADTGKP
jgi:hypothetical protein